MVDQAVHPEADRWGGWSWREASRGEHFRRCSYCGSVNPEDLAAESSWTANWADQKYGWPHKFYVDIPNRDPGRLYVISCSWSDEAPSPLGSLGPYLAIADLSPEQREVVERDGYTRSTTPEGKTPTWFQFDTRANHFGKFYSIHLSDADLQAEVKADIEHRSGLAFDFADGRVAWRPAGR